ncbi:MULTISPECIES: hypothetical protein [unclassified Lysinibacillus]|uniref:hypothetical protein n=1 Tax=unclassified Lysinibacillus TaxID=2636778 RepID=UPI002553B538|nr:MULTISPECIES: hypothetical protein [unclassified Lysinibacillus]MDM5247414.1 hypothetical protein [Lysinibacillus sp. G4S2]
MKKILICNLLILVLVGCSPTINTNPTANSILKEHSQADILQYNNLIYINATSLESMKQLEYTKSEKIGKIIKTTNSSKNFKDFYATKLESGTEIFSTNDHNIYTIIAESNGQQILYTALLEG